MGNRKGKKAPRASISTATMKSWDSTPTIAIQKGPGSSLLHYNNTLWPTDEAIQSETADVEERTLTPHQIVNLDENHLFAWCMLCSALLLVEYPLQLHLPYLDPSISKEPASAVVATLCRSCKRKGGGDCGSSHLAGEYFQTKKIYKNMCKIACRAVGVPTDSGQYVRFVSMEYISTSMTDKCVLLGLNFASVGNERRDSYRLHLSTCFI